MIGRPLLYRVEFLNRSRIPGIGAQPVHRFRREGYQPTLPKEFSRPANFWAHSVFVELLAPAFDARSLRDQLLTLLSEERFLLYCFKHECMRTLAGPFHQGSNAFLQTLGQLQPGGHAFASVI